MMIPYGLSLATVSLIGNSLGANKPYQAMANCKMVLLVSMTCAFIFVLCLYFSKKGLISLFTSDPDVSNIAENSFIIFALAFTFDWNQCCASGVIKGAGKQGIASLCSLLCLIIVAMPTSYLLSFKSDWDLNGLWVGYGASAFVLTLLYIMILSKINW